MRENPFETATPEDVAEQEAQILADVRRMERFQTVKLLRTLISEVKDLIGGESLAAELAECSDSLVKVLALFKRNEVRWRVIAKRQSRNLQHVEKVCVEWMKKNPTKEKKE